MNHFQFVLALLVIVAVICCTSAGYLGHGYSSGISYSFDNQKAPLHYGKFVGGYGYGYGGYGYGHGGYGKLGYAGLGYGGFGGYGGYGYGGLL